MKFTNAFPKGRRSSISHLRPSPLLSQRTSCFLRNALPFSESYVLLPDDVVADGKVRVVQGKVTGELPDGTWVREDLNYQGVIMPRRFPAQGPARGQESVIHAKQLRPPRGLTERNVASTLVARPAQPGARPPELAQAEAEAEAQAPTAEEQQNEPAHQ